MATIVLNYSNSITSLPSAIYYSHNRMFHKMTSLIRGCFVLLHRGFGSRSSTCSLLHNRNEKLGNVYSKTNWKEFVTFSKCKKFGQRSTANDLKPTQTNSDLHIQFSFRGRLSVRQRSATLVYGICNLNLRFSIICLSFIRHTKNCLCREIRQFYIKYKK